MERMHSQSDTTDNRLFVVVVLVWLHRITNERQEVDNDKGGIGDHTGSGVCTSRTKMVLQYGIITNEHDAVHIPFL